MKDLLGDSGASQKRRMKRGGKADKILQEEGEMGEPHAEQAAAGFLEEASELGKGLH